MKNYSFEILQSAQMACIGWSTAYFGRKMADGGPLYCTLKYRFKNVTHTFTCMHTSNT